MLTGEGDADYGDEQKRGEQKMHQCGIKTAEDQPDNIAEDR